MSLLASIGSYVTMNTVPPALLGSEWVLAPAGTISHSITSGATSGALFIASDMPTGASVSTTYLSSNGVNWTTQTGKTYGFRGLTWISQFSKFYAGEGNAGRISTTTDGITWTVVVVGSAQWNGFGGNGTTAVAVGNSGVVATSTNGTTWTSRSSGGTNNLHAVTWDPYRNRFFMAGSFVFLHSDNGINWYSGGTAAGIRRAIAVSPSIMVQVGDAGAIYTSTTGTTSGSWTQRAGGTNANLYSVVWTGEQFVACGDGGTILNSVDGITWTTVSSGTANSLRTIIATPTRLSALGNNTLVYTP